MAFNPDEKPREFLVLVIAAFRFAMNLGIPPDIAFSHAEEFVAEAEKRYGPLDK